MRGVVISIHRQYPRAAVQVGSDDFFVVESKYRDDLTLRNVISADFTLSRVSWFLNLTTESLVYGKVLGRFSTRISATDALSMDEFSGICIPGPGTRRMTVPISEQS